MLHAAQPKFACLRKWGVFWVLCTKGGAKHAVITTRCLQGGGSQVFPARLVDLLERRHTRYFPAYRVMQGLPPCLFIYFLSFLFESLLDFFSSGSAAGRSAYAPSISWDFIFGKLWFFFVFFMRIKRRGGTFTHHTQNKQEVFDYCCMQGHSFSFLCCFFFVASLQKSNLV